MSRLRGRLEQYYATLGKDDPLVIVLPRGGYVPRFETREIAAAPAPTTAVPKPFPWIAAASAAVVLASVALFFLLRRTPQPQTPLLELDIALPAGTRLANVVGTQLAVSPSGATLVYAVARTEGGSELWLRRLDSRDPAKSLPGTEGARGPFFSPDSEWVAFWAGGKLKKIPVRGGSPTILCDAPDLLGGSWGDDGNIVAALTGEAKVWRVPSAGGKPTVALDLSAQTARLLWPQVLPGSDAVLVSNVGTTPDSGSVEWCSLKTGARQVLVKNGVFGRYLPSGHLLYVNQGTVYAQRLQLSNHQTLGNPVAVVVGIAQSPVFGFAQFDFSANGLFVYQRQPAGGNLTLNWLDANGNAQPAVATPGAYLWPRVAPDGKHAAYVTLPSGESRVWITGPDQKSPIPITPDGGSYANPLWTPDGRFIIVQGRGTLEWLSTASGASRPKVLLPGGVMAPASFSPDGKYLAYSRLDPQTHFDLWTVPIERRDGGLVAGKPQPFLNTKAVETAPAFSPDGKWLAYVSLQSGTYEVYVRAFPDNGQEFQVSRGGGRLPAWSRTRQEIVYETEDHRLMTVPWQVTAQGKFDSGTPRLLFERKLAPTGVLANYDLAPDGRILALMPAATQGPAPIESLNATVNFFEALQRRLPE